MRFVFKVALPALLSSFLNACFFELPAEEATKRDMAKGEEQVALELAPKDGDPETEECRASSTAACIIGQIVAAPSVLINDQEYFDVEAFGRAIPALLDVRDAAGNVRSDVEARFEPALSNRSFTRDFSAYVKGTRAQSTRTNERGLFKFQDLPRGLYDLRVQRTFHISLEAATTEIKRLCVTIYADDTSLKLPAEGAVYKGFDSFKLLFQDVDCLAPVKPGQVVF